MPPKKRKIIDDPTTSTTTTTTTPISQSDDVNNNAAESGSGELKNNAKHYNSYNRKVPVSDRQFANVDNYSAKNHNYVYADKMAVPSDITLKYDGIFLYEAKTNKKIYKAEELDKFEFLQKVRGENIQRVKVKITQKDLTGNGRLVDCETGKDIGKHAPIYKYEGNFYYLKDSEPKLLWKRKKYYDHIRHTSLAVIDKEKNRIERLEVCDLILRDNQLFTTDNKKVMSYGVAIKISEKKGAQNEHQSKKRRGVNVKNDNKLSESDTEPELESKPKLEKLTKQENISTTLSLPSSHSFFSKISDTSNNNNSDDNNNNNAHPELKETTPFGIKKIENAVISANPPAPTASYSVNSKEACEKLEQYERNKDGGKEIKYNREINEERLANTDLYIRMLPSINQLGVFNGSRPIQAIHYKNGAFELLKYVGKKRWVEEAQKKGHYYLFDTGYVQKNETLCLDAESYRDVSAYINHSEQPNLVARIEGEKIYLCLREGAVIGPDHQLTYDYDGKSYFDFHLDNSRPLFIHPSDGYKSAAECYTKNKESYISDLFQFDPSTMKDLQLTGSNLVLPKLFLTIIEGDEEALNKFLEDNPKTQLDLFAYLCDAEGKLKPDGQQQNLTPLMLACLLGKKECIKKLIQAGAQLDRCMLITGDTPLSLLLRGRADRATKEELGMYILEQMEFPIIINNQQSTILHYAIEANCPELVKRILNCKHGKDKRDTVHKLTQAIFNKNGKDPIHHLFDYCVKSNKIEILTTLLNWIKANKEAKEQFIGHLRAGLAFNENSLGNEKLKELLEKDNFAEFAKEISSLSVRAKKSQGQKTKKHKTSPGPISKNQTTTSSNFFSSKDNSSTSDAKQHKNNLESDKHHCFKQRS